MKKIIVAVFTLGLVTAASSQKTDTSMHTAAIAVCDCLTKANFSDKTSEDEMQKAFLSCIFTSAPDLITKIMSSGDDYSKAGQELGTQLAMEMMKNGCPAFIKIAGSMSMGGNDSDDGNNTDMFGSTSKPEQDVESADGLVTKVEERDFTYITVKTTAGRELTFIYYSYVPGSDDWVKDAANKLKNKNIAVSYVESEVYQPKFKQFMNVKEIKTLTIK